MRMKRRVAFCMILWLFQYAASQDQMYVLPPKLNRNTSFNKASLFQSVAPSSSSDVGSSNQIGMPALQVSNQLGLNASNTTIVSPFVNDSNANASTNSTSTSQIKSLKGSTNDNNSGLSDGSVDSNQPPVLLDNSSVLVDPNASNSSNQSAGMAESTKKGLIIASSVAAAAATVALIGGVGYGIYKHRRNSKRSGIYKLQQATRQHARDNTPDHLKRLNSIGSESSSSLHSGNGNQKNQGEEAFLFRPASPFSYHSSSSSISSMNGEDLASSPRSPETSPTFIDESNLNSKGNHHSNDKRKDFNSFFGINHNHGRQNRPKKDFFDMTRYQTANALLNRHLAAFQKSNAEAKDKIHFIGEHQPKSSVKSTREKIESSNTHKGHENNEQFFAIHKSNLQNGQPSFHSQKLLSQKNHFNFDQSKQHSPQGSPHEQDQKTIWHKQTKSVNFQSGSNNLASSPGLHRSPSHPSSPPLLRKNSHTQIFPKRHPNGHLSSSPPHALYYHGSLV